MKKTKVVETQRPGDEGFQKYKTCTQVFFIYADLKREISEIFPHQSTALKTTENPLKIDGWKMYSLSEMVTF